MSKTVVINRLGNGGVTVQVNGGVPRSINDSLNILVQPLGNNVGCVVKSTDEGFRMLLYLTDTITINGTVAPTVLSDLIQVLSDGVFSGSQAYAAPSKFNQTITFPGPAGAAHTAPPITLVGSSSSGLPITYTSSDVTKFTIAGNILTPVAAGTANITASQAGNGNYNSATPVVRSLTLT